MAFAFKVMSQSRAILFMGTQRMLLEMVVQLFLNDVRSLKYLKDKSQERKSLKNSKKKVTRHKFTYKRN